jgi:hypothetical protein
VATKTGTGASAISSTVGVFATGEEAILALQKMKDSGFESSRVSVIGKGVKQPRDVHAWVPGSTEERSGGWSDLWEAISGWLLLGFIWLPGVGWVAAAGWFAATIVGTGAGGGLGILGTLGVPSTDIAGYETQLKADRYLVIVHGDAESVEQAHEILESAHPYHVTSYGP